MGKKEQAETVATVETKPKYSIEELRSNCVALFGVTSSTFDGATYGLNGDYTVDEMKQVIEKWQKKSIKKEAK